MRKKNFLAVLSAGALLSAMLTGCAANQGDLGNKNIRTKMVREDANGNKMLKDRFANDHMNEKNYVNGKNIRGNNIVGSHKNYKMEMSEEIAKRIANKHNVRSANVLLTDNNAYVAVSFEDNLNNGDKKLMSRTNSSYMGRDGSNYQRRMNTMSTGENALTSQIKADIAKEVRRVKPGVDNVYVSANPDFVGRMTSYMTDVRNGHPIQGFLVEFNAMAERLFPANANKIETRNYGGDMNYRSMTDRTDRDNYTNAHRSSPMIYD
ncbi:YhcN/YlaJ family sporulation lipoprotein [Paenibacillus sp. FSL H8-0537]|uniref:YhcN/YlaJ family sporulation lipoprotein n=1 Tax=Paenibacillus sp. FSL H8-0537 TaxID=2921399 RepID=UPI0031015A37